MVRIALPADIEEPLSEQARERGITPEELALETLRATFSKPSNRETKSAETLFDFLSGYVGTVEGSTEDVSSSGQLFAEGLLEKQRRGHL